MSIRIYIYEIYTYIYTHIYTHTCTCGGEAPLNKDQCVRVCERMIQVMEDDSFSLTWLSPLLFHCDSLYSDNIILLFQHLYLLHTIKFLNILTQYSEQYSHDRYSEENSDSIQRLESILRFQKPQENCHFHTLAVSNQSSFLKGQPSQLL